MEGCLSHSGRRTFITNAAKMISQAGGTINDVRQLAGHSSKGIYNIIQKPIKKLLR